MYSGGIDSTCVVVSLLKHATPEQKKHIVILLSQDSITENPRFYDEHLKSNFRLESSIGFAKHLGGEVILLSAELNDQLLGANAVRDVIINYGSTFIHAPYDRERIVAFYSRCLGGNTSEARHFVSLFEGLRDTASIPIQTNLDFLWWINFTTKWQACLLYVLLFTPPENTARITPDYLRDRFISFFNTDDFQLWSMNNLDKRIKDTWKTYKWVAKDVIYAFNKDTEYRDHKMKRGSLGALTNHLYHNLFVDDQWRFANNLDFSSVAERENDFAW